MEQTRIKRGDFVRVRFGPSDEWMNAFVALASDTDPSSVMLMFEGMVRASHGWIGRVLPLSIDYRAESVVSSFGDTYEIEVTEEGGTR